MVTKRAEIVRKKEMGHGAQRVTLLGCICQEKKAVGGSLVASKRVKKIF